MQITYFKSYYRENKDRLSEYQKQYYAKNKTRIKERCRKYNQEHKNETKQRAHNYYEKNKEKIKTRVRNYRIKNKEKIAERLKLDRINNPEKYKIINKKRYWSDVEGNKKHAHEWYLNNKTRHKERGYLWLKNHPEHKLWLKQWHKNNQIEKSKNPEWRKKQSLRAIEYGKKHPDKKLKNIKDHLLRISNEIDMTVSSYKYGLMMWSKTIKKQYNNKCVICGSNDDINAHHLLYKRLYPKLSLNLNNGVLLCRVHHNEIHFPRGIMS